jgi:TIR domain
VETERVQPRRVWIVMVDSRNSEDLRDLDHLDSILWGANRHSKRGDLVLMYRTAPYSDIPYVFVAGSDPRPTRREDGADTDHVIELVDKVRLLRPLSLAQIKRIPELASWSFARNQQGAMRRRRDVKEEGVWPALRSALVAGNPQLLDTLRERDEPESATTSREIKEQPRRLKIFLSYASEDRDSVLELRDRLSAQSYFVPWVDVTDIVAGEDWKDAIRAALDSSDVVVICMSSHSLQNRRFLKTEIGWALKIAEVRSEGTLVIIPAKIEPCPVPRRLSRWQWVDLFQEDGHLKLTNDLQKHLSRRSR